MMTPPKAKSNIAKELTVLINKIFYVRNLHYHNEFLKFLKS